MSPPLGRGRQSVKDFAEWDGEESAAGGGAACQLMRFGRGVVAVLHGRVGAFAPDGGERGLARRRREGSRVEGGGCNLRFH